MKEHVCVVGWLQPGIGGLGPEDFGRICDLYRQFTLAAHAPELSIQQVARAAAHEHLAVARRGERTRAGTPRIVGMGTLYALHAIDRDVGRIGQFVVDEEERGKGVGAAIVEFLVAEAHKLGLRELGLTSDRRRPQAHAFWEKVGFSYKESVVMRMQL